jgi:heptosyltransferase-2
MLYILLSYIFYPLLFFLTALRKNNRYERILVIQIAKIGDLICSTPLFREIKRKYPNCSVSAMVNPVAKEILDENPYLDAVISLKSTEYKGFLGKVKLAALLREGHYDAVVCLNPSVSFAVASLWGLVPLRISIIPDCLGITFKFCQPFFTHLEPHLPGILITETCVRTLEGLGIRTEDLSKEVYKSEVADATANQIVGSETGSLIGIAVGSANKLKEIEPEKIAKLVELLLKTFNDHIVFIGSQQDSKTADAILSAVTRKDRIINATGALSLSELPALMERLSVFIAVDTGIAYMADALSVPIIHLAGPVDTTEQRPAGKRVITIQHHLPCVPCTKVFRTVIECKLGTKACIKAVTEEEIVMAVRRLRV